MASVPAELSAASFSAGASENATERYSEAGAVTAASASGAASSIGSSPSLRVSSPSLRWPKRQRTHNDANMEAGLVEGVLEQGEIHARHTNGSARDRVRRELNTDSIGNADVLEVGVEGHDHDDELHDEPLLSGGDLDSVSAGPRRCAICSNPLPWPFVPFDNGMPPVCRGGDCEDRMRTNFEQASQRAPESGKAAERSLRTRAIATVLAQNGSSAQQRAAPPAAETFVYEPAEADANPARMPSLLEPYRVRSIATRAFASITPGLQIMELFVYAFGCGSGKSHQIFALMKDILSHNPRRPVLFVSCRKVHAGDLGNELKEMSFLVYLKDESAGGMGLRIKEHVDYQAEKGFGPRIVCSLNSIRALPKVYLDMFESNHGVIVYDEARSIAAYVREFAPNETCAFPRPDEVLDRLAKLAASSTVIVSDADALCEGTVLELARRVAPQKSIRCVCASTPMVERDVEIAFAGGIAGKKAGTDDDDNVGRRSILRRLFAATRRARGDVEDRVYVQCAGKKQIDRVKEMLEQRGLWDQQRCKMYWGESPEKADLTNTAEAWADVYIVLCNSAVTVAINIKVRFGAVFMFTSNDKSAVVRDMFQGVARTWRKPELEPRASAMGRGSDGRCRIFALLGCAAPKGLLTAEEASVGLGGGGGRTGGKKGHVVAPTDFPNWQQHEHAKALKLLQSGAAESQAKLGGAGEVLKPETMAIIAWNTVERKANTSQHFTYFTHLSSLGTREWVVRCLEPFDDAAPEHPPPTAGEQMEEAGGGEEDDEHDEEVFDVAAADLAIRGCSLDDVKVYTWFVSTFVAFFGPPRFAFWELTAAFFGACSKGPWCYAEFVKRLKQRDEHVDTGDGAMANALKTIFQTLRPIERIVASCKKEAAYMCLKHNEVALRRSAIVHLFSAAELRKRPPTVQLGVQKTDLDILSTLTRMASYMQLSVDDLLSFAPGQGGFSISGSDVPEAPVEMGCEDAPLDFTPRPPAGPGQQPGDLHCGGRWGFAGDVDERFNEDTASDAIKNAWKAIQQAERDLNIKVRSRSATPLAFVSQILQATVQVELKMERVKGKTVSGTTTNRKLQSLTFRRCAKGLLERIQIKHVPTAAAAAGGRDDRAEPQWSAAWEYKEKQRKLDTNMGSAPLDSADVQLDTDAAWQEGGLSADAAGRAQQSMDAVIMAHSEPQQREWPQHMLQLDVSGVEQVLTAVRGAEAAGVTDTHQGVGSVTELLHTLVDAKAGALDDGGVPIATLREPEGCGPRRYTGTFNPLDASSEALAVMSGGKYDCLHMEDAGIPGALPLRLLQKHVHLQRQLLSGSRSAENSELLHDLTVQLQEAQACVQELDGKVRGGDLAEPTLRGLLWARGEEQAVVAALASAQTGAHKAAPSSNGGGSSVADGVLPSTTKLEALLRSSSGDCSALVRALNGSSAPNSLAQSHKEVYYEVCRLIDTLVAKGGGWQAELKTKHNNRKMGELRGLSSEDKTNKEKELKSWARVMVLERLLDDAALLAEQQLAKQNGGAQYVHFVDARGRLHPTSVLLYVLRDAAGPAAPTQTLCLPSIGANVTLRLDNSKLDGITSTGVAAGLRRLTGDAEGAAREEAEAAASASDMDENELAEAEQASGDEGESDGEEGVVMGNGEVPMAAPTSFDCALCYSKKPMESAVKVDGCKHPDDLVCGGCMFTEVCGNAASCPLCRDPATALVQVATGRRYEVTDKTLSRVHTQGGELAEPGDPEACHTCRKFGFLFECGGCKENRCFKCSGLDWPPEESDPFSCETCADARGSSRLVTSQRVTGSR